MKTEITIEAVKCDIDSCIGCMFINAKKCCSIAKVLIENKLANCYDGYIYKIKEKDNE